MPHRGSRRRTLLAISKRSPPSEELKPGASCSRTCSGGWSASRSISEFASRDHLGTEAFEAGTHVITNVVDHGLRPMVLVQCAELTSNHMPGRPRPTFSVT
jgi:hypothetical protein